MISFLSRKLKFLFFFLSLWIYLWLAETSQQPISQTTWLKVTPHCNHCTEHDKRTYQYFPSQTTVVLADLPIFRLYRISTSLPRRLLYWLIYPSSGCIELVLPFPDDCCIGWSTHLQAVLNLSCWPSWMQTHTHMYNTYIHTQAHQTMHTYVHKYTRSYVKNTRSYEKR